MALCEGIIYGLIILIIIKIIQQIFPILFRITPHREVIAYVHITVSQKHIYNFNPKVRTIDACVCPWVEDLNKWNNESNTLFDVKNVGWVLEKEKVLLTILMYKWVRRRFWIKQKGRQILYCTWRQGCAHYMTKTWFMLFQNNKSIAMERESDERRWTHFSATGEENWERELSQAKNVWEEKKGGW